MRVRSGHTVCVGRGAWVAVAVLGLAAAACAKAVPTSTASEEHATLAPSETFTPKGSTLQIQFVGVVQDSRCPLGVSCVSARNAVASFAFGPPFPGALPALRQLNTSVEPTSMTVNGYTFRLEALTPVPTVGGVVAPSAYRAQLVVVRTPSA